MDTVIELAWTTVVVDGQTALFFPATGWRAVGTLSAARALLEVAAKVGSDIDVAVAVQVANHIDAPGAPTALGSYLVNAVDVQYPTAWTDLSSAVAGAQLVRFGFLVKRASGSGLVAARAGGRISLRSC
jgi:hypothetical protein